MLQKGLGKLFEWTGGRCGGKRGSGAMGKGLLTLGQSMCYLYDGIYVFL